MLNIPEPLKVCNDWVCYKRAASNRKIPKNPKNGRNCTGDYENWGVSYQQAVEAVKKYGFDGLGFVFKKGNGFCGIDLDDCITEGGIVPKAKKVVDFCKSYTEVSVSGKGLHIIIEKNGHEPFVKKDKGIEIYTQDRFFALTGTPLLNAGEEDGHKYSLKLVDPREAYAVWSRRDSLVGELFKEELTVGEMAALVRKMKSNPKFKKLWNGDFQNYGSQSEADLALCSIISYYTDGNKLRIDQIFRKSKLFRPDKWDRPTGDHGTYGNMTIDKAISVEEDKDEIIKETPSKKMRPMTLSEFIITPRPPIQTIMDPWMTTGSTHMIYGPRGAGKTFFALSIALAITRDTDFGAWSINQPVNCLYCDGEMMPQDMVARVRGLSHNTGKEAKTLYILSSGQLQYEGIPSVNISREKHQKEIYEMIIENEIGAVFLDNISALTPGIDENVSTEWDNIAQWANIIKRTGCAVIFIHHAGKAGTQRGTSGREDMLDTVIKLKPVSADAADGLNVNVVFEKSRHIAGEKAMSSGFTLIGEPGKESLTWGFTGPGNVKREKIIEMLVEGKTYSDIVETLNVSKKTIIKYKSFAVEKGIIKKTDTGFEYVNKHTGKIITDEF
jgi:KaiC/GvpD/RAD55 family RecA-like ATPase